MQLALGDGEAVGGAAADDVEAEVDVDPEQLPQPQRLRPAVDQGDRARDSAEARSAELHPAEAEINRSDP